MSTIITADQTQVEQSGRIKGVSDHTLNPFRYSFNRGEKVTVTLTDCQEEPDAVELWRGEFNSLREARLHVESLYPCQIPSYGYRDGWLAYMLV